MFFERLSFFRALNILIEFLNVGLLQMLLFSEFSLVLMKRNFFIRDQLENQVIQELKACLAFKDNPELQDLQVHLAHLAKL